VFTLKSESGVFVENWQLQFGFENEKSLFPAHGKRLLAMKLKNPVPNYSY